MVPEVHVTADLVAPGKSVQQFVNNHLCRLFVVSKELVLLLLLLT